MTQKSPAWISGYDCPCTFLTQASPCGESWPFCDWRLTGFHAVLIGTSAANWKGVLESRITFWLNNTEKILLLGLSSAEHFKKAHWGLLISLRANPKHSFLPRYWQYLGKMLYFFSGLCLVLTAKKGVCILQSVVPLVSSASQATSQGKHQQLGLRCTSVHHWTSSCMLESYRAFPPCPFSLSLSFLSLHKDFVQNRISTAC